MPRAATPIYGGLNAADRPQSETPLSAWLRAHGLSAYALAKKIGCDPRMVILWATGRCEISLVNAFKVERATGGGVPVSSWLGTDLFKARWNASGADWEGLTEQRAEGQKRRKEAARAENPGKP